MKVTHHIKNTLWRLTLRVFGRTRQAMEQLIQARVIKKSKRVGSVWKKLHRRVHIALVIAGF
jgi:hypothetical protein